MNIGSILIAILVFGVMIFVHELGHFLTAKASGIQVNEFAMGMGPKLLSFGKGETVYSLRLFPIGGFCAMEGEDEESENERSFNNAKLWKRAAVMVAGAAMNLLLGFIVLIIMNSTLELIPIPKISGFREGAVSNQWLQEGDTVTRINNHRIRTTSDLQLQLMMDNDGVMDIEVERNEEKILLSDVTFKLQNYPDLGAAATVDFGIYGVEPTAGNVLYNSFFGVGSLANQVWSTLMGLFQQRFTVDQLSGPVGVTSAIGEATSMGMNYLLNMVALITVNLGVFNLLPFPALDGGRLIFLLIEAIRRKPVPGKIETAVNAVGFMLLIGLMIFVSFNDVRKLFFQ